MSDRELLKSTLVRTAGCLSPEQLEQFAGEQAPSDPHVMQCPRCQAELELLKSFEAAAPLPNEGAGVAWIGAHLDRQLDTIKNASRVRTPQLLVLPRMRRSWFAKIFDLRGMRWAMPLTAMAAMAIAVAVLLHSPGEPKLQASSSAQRAIYRSQELQLLSPIGDMEQVPRQLHWEPVEGAVNYQIALMEVDDSVLWSAESGADSVEIPASVRAKMLPGKPILWQVKAVDVQRKVLATSQVQEFVSPRERSSRSVQ